MLGIGAIEIREASYSLGMCGYIVWQNNKTHEWLKVRLSMSDGLRLSRSKDGNTWSGERRVRDDELLAVLPAGHGWDMDRFIAVWAGFAEGYQRGKRERDRGIQ